LTILVHNVWISSVALAATSIFAVWKPQCSGPV
jgi:hypothetical protein